jgi:hypothetical protein
MLAVDLQALATTAEEQVVARALLAEPIQRV